MYSDRVVLSRKAFKRSGLRDKSNPYRSSRGDFFRVVGIIILLGTYALLGLMMAHTVRYGFTWGSPGDLIVPILVAHGVALALINYFPNVWLSDDGIVISYNLFWYIFLPWDNVLALERGFPQGMGTRLIAKDISLFHYLYSHSSRYPAFWVSDDIQERQKVIADIKARAGSS